MILITGGTGFIGTHLTRLLASTHQIRILTHHAYLPADLSKQANIELVVGDLNQHQTLQNAMVGVDIVIHLAWTTVPKNATENPTFDIQSNVIGTVHLLQSAVNEGVKQFIFISSGGTVYGIPQTTPIPETHPLNPISAYGISKMTAEKYIKLYHHLYKLNYTILRVSNCYGTGQNLLKRQGVIGLWLNAISTNKPIEVWGDGTAIRDYIHIEDAIKAISRVSNNPQAFNKVFNLGASVGISLNTVLKHIQTQTGIKPQTNYKVGRGFDVPTNVLDTTYIQKEIGWKATKSFANGILEMWEALKQ